MFKKIAEFFTGKKPEAAPEAPYKVEAAPVVEAAPTPAVEAVVVVPDAVAPAAVVEAAPVAAITATPKKTRAPAKPKKQQFEKKPAAPKKPRKAKSQPQA